MSRYKPIIKERGYVCDPPYLSIKAFQGVPHQGLTIKIYIDTTLSFLQFYKTHLTNDRDILDEKVKYVLNLLLLSLTRDEFENSILGTTISGLNFYDKVKWVKNKSGTTVWKRP